MVLKPGLSAYEVDRYLWETTEVLRTLITGKKTEFHCILIDAGLWRIPLPLVLTNANRSESRLIGHYLILLFFGDSTVTKRAERLLRKGKSTITTYTISGIEKVEKFLRVKNLTSKLVHLARSDKFEPSFHATIRYDDIEVNNGDELEDALWDFLSSIGYSRLRKEVWYTPENSPFIPVDEFNEIVWVEPIAETLVSNRRIDRVSLMVRDV